jgi:hypothetical protein
MLAYCSGDMLKRFYLFEEIAGNRPPLVLELITWATSRATPAEGALLIGFSDEGLRVNGEDLKQILELLSEVV